MDKQSIGSIYATSLVRLYLDDLEHLDSRLDI